MIKQNSRSLKLKALGLVAVHFLVVVLHSIAHEALSIKATPAQFAFIIPVIIAAPVVAAPLFLKSEKMGAWLLAISMAGSFFFGLYYHFVASTIDHVAHVAGLQPAFWTATFIVTAFLLGLAEILGIFTGFLILIKQPRFSQDYATRTGL
jgi:hypothetical protein